MTGASKLARVCICEGYAPGALAPHVTQLFCPVCQSRPAVRELASAGEPLFPGWAGKKVPTELRGVAGLREWRGANRLGTHSFRGGAARVISVAGGSSSQLLRSGQWHSSDYEPYLDLGR